MSKFTMFFSTVYNENQDTTDLQDCLDHWRMWRRTSLWWQRHCSSSLLTLSSLSEPSCLFSGTSCPWNHHSWLALQYYLIRLWCNIFHNKYLGISLWSSSSGSALVHPHSYYHQWQAWLWSSCAHWSWSPPSSPPSQAPPCPWRTSSTRLWSCPWHHWLFLSQRISV